MALRQRLPIPKMIGEALETIVRAIAWLTPSYEPTRIYGRRCEFEQDDADGQLRAIRPADTSAYPSIVGELLRGRNRRDGPIAVLQGFSSYAKPDRRLSMRRWKFTGGYRDRFHSQSFSEIFGNSSLTWSLKVKLAKIHPMLIIFKLNRKY